MDRPASALERRFPDIENSVIHLLLHENDGDVEQTEKQLILMTSAPPSVIAAASPKASCVSEVKGDLFSCGASDSLAHCVSEDLRMGKGIAVLFKQRFGGVAELEAQHRKVGDVAILHRGPRYIYYLITKLKYYHKPPYADLRRTLIVMRDHAVASGVAKIAVPRLGCGLDGLEWSQVLMMLKDVFSGSGVSIDVYTPP